MPRLFKPLRFLLSKNLVPMKKALLQEQIQKS
jgi:hypothetical protein